MSLVLHRTAVHFFDDGSDAVVKVSVLTFDTNEKAIAVDGDTERSPLIFGPEQARALIRAIKSAAYECDWDEIKD